jgi:selenocysteine lyase/cysteine desulfurase
MAGRVREGLRRHPQVRLLNASADEFYGGLVSFEAVRGDLRGVVRECAARQIRIAGGPQRIRIATHIFTRQGEIDSFFEAVDRGLRG